jgi:hypothetical protein
MSRNIVGAWHRDDTQHMVISEQCNNASFEDVCLVILLYN